MPAFCAPTYAIPFGIVGSVEQVKEAMGLNRYDEHCLGYRWFQYVQDDARRWASVEAELRKMRAERRGQESFLEAAE